MEKYSKISLFIIFLFLSSLTYSTIHDVDTTFQISINGTLNSAPEVLSKYIQHESISNNEKSAGEFLKNICIENGLHISQFGNENGNYNFAASIFALSDKKPNIIFLNHIDVVDAGDTLLWEYPPFSGYINDTVVWGRGAFDNKGAAIMQLFSILKFKSLNKIDDLKYNITLLSVSGEEIISEGGIKYVIDNHFDELNAATVIGEGATELSNLIEYKGEEQMFGISVAHKRAFWLSLSLNVPSSGHGSVTPENYAPKEMARIISKLSKAKTPMIYTRENIQILKSLASTKKGISKFILNNPRIFKPLLSSVLRKQPEIFALFTNTITVTSIVSDNKAINMIPQIAYAKLDCRLLPHVSEKQFLQDLKKRLKNKKLEIQILREQSIIPVSDNNNNHYENMEAAVHQTYKNAKVFPIILPNFNDVGNFRIRGVQSYSIIPVELDVEYMKCVHAPNERIPIQALTQGIEVYYNFLNLSEKKP